jgi:Fe-S-cluster containining protein
MRSARATAWLDAIRTPAVRAGLESIYTHAAREIEARGPACWASGRCCNFAKTGHRLYVTGLEAAYCLDNLHTIPAPPATPSTISLQQARAAGGCSFQLANLCSVHTIKPLGCRVYFCDRSAQQWQNELTERLLAELRALHGTHHIEYLYAEWRGVLDLFTDAPSPSP